jgi:hypothetical protein
MSAIKAAQLNMAYDGGGNAFMTYQITYADGGVAQGNASGQFAQQLISTFFPQAMADLSKGQQDDGDAGTGI